MQWQGILAGCLVTVIAWALSVFFAYGGIRRRKVFLRTLKLQGKWRRNRLIMAAIGILISCYGFWLYGFGWDYVMFMMLASLLGAVTVTDLRSREIPDDAVLFYAVLFSIWTLLSLNTSMIFNGLIGALAGFAVPLFAYFVRKDSIGMGDIKLLGCIGLAGGFPGILFIILRAMVFGGIFSIILLITKKGNMKTELPFAPFLLIAALI